MQVNLEGLEGFIEQRVREVVAEALGSKADEDPWLDSKAAAAHAGVSVQRIHDAVCLANCLGMARRGRGCSSAAANSTPGVRAGHEAVPRTGEALRLRSGYLLGGNTTNGRAALERPRPGTVIGGHDAERR